MNLLNKIFGEKTNNVNASGTFWKIIESENDLHEAFTESENRTVAIFKHSTRCFISKTVLKNFEREVSENQNSEAAFYFLDLIKYRHISDIIAEYFSVRHESPQLIVFRNRAVKNSASHQDISIQQII